MKEVKMECLKTPYVVLSTSIWVGTGICANGGLRPRGWCLSTQTEAHVHADAATFGQMLQCVEVTNGRGSIVLVLVLVCPSSSVRMTTLFPGAYQHVQLSCIIRLYNIYYGNVYNFLCGSQLETWYCKSTQLH
jgi:hypothetical protein